MEIFLSLLSITLVVAWGVCYIGYGAEGIVHLLLIAALLPLMLQGMLRKYAS